MKKKKEEDFNCALFLPAIKGYSLSDTDSQKKLFTVNKTIILIQLKIFSKTVSPSDRPGHGRVLTAMSNVYPNPVVRGHGGGGGGGGGSGLLPCPPLPPYSVAAPLYFPVPAVTYHGVQGALSVGKFPNPHNVSQVISGRKTNCSINICTISKFS